MRRRLDAELVRRGLAESRTQARGLIEQRRVLVAGSIADKAARQVDAADPLVVEGEPDRYVGRGALKLEGALDRFGLRPEGVRVLDAGASTGGFTDVLLQRGAREVVALDVGHGQLHERLRADPRVVVLERTNLRHVDARELGPFDAAVADLSFISLTVVMEVLVSCVEPGGWLVLLVKPQFEAGRRDVSRGRGIVRDPQVWTETLERVAASAGSAGAVVEGLVPSPLRGTDGNVEFLMHLKAPEGPGSDRSDDAGTAIPAAAERLIETAVAEVAPPVAAVEPG